ncbi:MAG: TIGR02611 family protein [Gaiellaceae bacterium]
MEERPRRRFVEMVRERRERHRQRSRIVRAAVALAGFVVVLAGLAMIPLPGPGLLIVAAGLAILALEFVWAERWLERTIERVDAASDKVKRASRAQQVILGLLVVLAVAAVVTLAYAWDLPFLPG